MLTIDEKQFYNKIINSDIILKILKNQGDEVGLVIVSIAYTKNTSLSMTYVGRPGGRNVLNIAITKVKDKMIVIKSIKSSDIQRKSEMGKNLKTFKIELNFYGTKKLLINWWC